MSSNKKSSAIRLLIVEDSEHDRLSYRRAVRDANCRGGFRITECEKAEEALALLENEATSFDLILTDQRLPGMSGLELCQELLSRDYSMPMVLITGTGTEQLALKALKLGVSDYIIKDGNQGYLDLLPVKLLEVVQKHNERAARIKAEKALRASEKKYRTLFEGSRDGFVLVDMKGNLLEFNSAFKNMLGYNKKELQSKTNADLTPKKWRSQESSIIKEQVLKKGYSRLYEKEYQKKDGTLLPVELRLYLARDDDNKPSGVWTFVRDISDRKRTERELLDRKEFTERILDNLPIGLAVNSIDTGKILHMNHMFVEITGWPRKSMADGDKILGCLFPDPTHRKEIRKKIYRVIANDGDTPIQTEDLVIRTKNGVQKHITADLILLKMQKVTITTIIDTSELRLLQSQLIRSERLAATGQLAASIAHEINSPLQAITLMLSELADKFGAGDDLSAGLLLLKDAYKSIRETVKNLLDLNRPGTEQQALVSVNEIIEKTVMLLEGYLKQNKTEIILHLSRKVPMTFGSTQELGQVFINLMTNAVEAMVGISRSGGKRKGQKDAKNEIAIQTKLQKRAIVITISDSGPGVEAGDIDYIFDPFYTRKKRMGIGIGLSTCLLIIESYGGIITVKNGAKENEGAVFTIKLPVVLDSVLEEWIL